MAQEKATIRVLVVEDNRGDARLIAEMLRESTRNVFEITNAASLRQGVVELQKSHPDVVLLDLSLSDSHGLATYDRLRKAAGDLPILVLTGLSDQTVAMSAVQRGAQDYLVKGEFGGQQLERAIRYALERSAILARLRASEQSLKQALDKINEEIELARQVQKAFLPRSMETIAGVDTAGLCLPSAQLGGDLFSLTALTPSRAAFLVFDIAGHGVAASLICAMAKFCFDMHIRADRSPETVFDLVNHDLNTYFPSHLYLTAFLAILDTERRSLTFTSAGHPPALIRRSVSGAVEQLKVTNPFIGLFPQSKYTLGAATVEPGDLVVLYTDGLIESMTPDGTQFGRQRLEETLQRISAASAGECIEAVMEERRKFAGAGPQQDDITLLAFRML